MRASQRGPSGVERGDRIKPTIREALAPTLVFQAMLAVCCLSCLRATLAQDVIPPLSEARFRQIQYQVFEAGQQQAACAKPALGGCAERPLEMPPSEEAPQLPFNEGLLPGSYGATRGTLAAAPNMIGDFFGGGTYFMGDLVSNAGADRPFKLSDNWQPLPVDRVYVNYHHFNNVTTRVSGLTAVNKQPFDRYTTGIEKTFFGGMMSLDFRAPYSSALNSTQVQSPSGPLAQNIEFGNLGLATKLLLISRERFALTGGAGLTFPTGDNYRLYNSEGNQIATLKNQSVHLQPFLGFVTTPGGRLFLQGIAQVDIDTNGNEASFIDTSNRLPVVRTGRIQSQTLLYTDLSLGCWMYDNPGALLVRGIAPIIEMHYTSAVQNTDSLYGEFTNVFNRQDFLNMTGGLVMAVGARSYLVMAGAVPLRAFPNRGYNAETGIQFIRRY